MAIRSDAGGGRAKTRTPKKRTANPSGAKKRMAPRMQKIRLVAEAPLKKVAAPWGFKERRLPTEVSTVTKSYRQGIIDDITALLQRRRKSAKKPR